MQGRQNCGGIEGACHCNAETMATKVSFCPRNNLPSLSADWQSNAILHSWTAAELSWRTQNAPKLVASGPELTALPQTISWWVVVGSYHTSQKTPLFGLWAPRCLPTPSMLICSNTTGTMTRLTLTMSSSWSQNQTKMKINEIRYCCLILPQQAIVLLQILLWVNGETCNGIKLQSTYSAYKTCSTDLTISLIFS